MNEQTRQTLMSSATEVWGTPQDLFDKLNQVFRFQLDVCALAHNAKCPDYFTPEQDGLAQTWGNRPCWMNPPYGRRGGGIDAWVTKAWQESRKGSQVLCLIPARVDTRYFQDVVFPYASAVCFMRGRLRFTDKTGQTQDAAPFPSALVVFGGCTRAQENLLRQLGHVALDFALTPIPENP